MRSSVLYRVNLISVESWSCHEYVIILSVEDAEPFFSAAALNVWNREERFTRSFYNPGCKSGLQQIAYSRLVFKKTVRDSVVNVRKRRKKRHVKGWVAAFVSRETSSSRVPQIGIGRVLLNGLPE